jgi:TorA maturation chaperone TorD
LSKESEPTRTDEARNVNLTRARIYSFLSRAFKVEVDETFLESIISTEPAIRLISESQGYAELAEGAKLLAEFTTHVKGLSKGDRKKLFTDLAVEYAGMFLAAGRNPVYLVESVYLGKDHLLYEKPYHDIIEAYKSLKFEKDKKFTEPEDHIAIEFEFMSGLCKWTVQALEKGNLEDAIAYLNLQKEFLGDHIAKWVPEVCKKIKGATKSTFYRAIAYLTNAFINMEKQMPDQLKEMLKAELAQKTVTTNPSPVVPEDLDRPKGSSVYSMS